METLTRLVSESLARHGFERPVDYRRLQWSRWFRCQSHHSLLLVPSRPGVFALAEEIVDFDSSNAHVGTAALGCPAERSSAADLNRGTDSESSVEERRFSAASSALQQEEAALAAGTPATRRMLAVTQFFEDDDMAFVLDRMLSRNNPMRGPLMSGRYFVRFVVIGDTLQRRSVCAALNQWIASQSLANQPIADRMPLNSTFGNQGIANAAEKMSGIGPHFAASLELTPATEYVPPSASYQGTASAVPREPFSFGAGSSR